MPADRIDKNTTERVFAVFQDAAGAGLTGLSPTLRIWRSSDGKYLDKDTPSWETTPDDATMTALDATNLPGVYYYDFAVPDLETTFIARCDGGATAANRYQFREFASDVTADSVAGNKAIQTIATGVVTVYDHDDSTAMHTLTPSVDSATSPTQNIITAG